MWNMGSWCPGSMLETQRRDAEDGARGSTVVLSRGAPNDTSSIRYRYLSMRLRVTRRAGGLRPGHYHLTGHRNVLLMYM